MANFNNLSQDPIVLGVHITDETIRRRRAAASAMDKFCTFLWRGADMFQSFGAFIINGGEDLKFYNSPSFSNEYSKPQFESAAGNLIGVTFETQKISFKVGVYWISEEDYRLLINFLHPYEINTLSFSFDSDYYYSVKLANLEDSTRYIVGEEFETTTSAGEKKRYSRLLSSSEANAATLPFNRTRHAQNYRYYTELTLTFEVQGPSCAYSSVPYTFRGAKNSDINKYDPSGVLYSSDFQPIEITDSETSQVVKEWIRLPFMASREDTDGIYDLVYSTSPYLSTDSSEKIETIIESDLPTPIEANFSLALQTESFIYLTLNFEAQYLTEYTDQNVQKQSILPITLFNVEFAKITERYTKTGFTGEDRILNLDLKYDSEAGLLFLAFGDSKYKLLTLQNTADTGEKIISAMQVNKFRLPGRFDNPYIKYNNIRFLLRLSGTQYGESNTLIAAQVPTTFFERNIRNSNIIVSARTNLI